LSRVKKRKSEKVSFHGLRYGYAQKLKERLDSEGVKNAAKQVSQSLGHNRVAMTKHYLSEMPKGKK
jgi:hypothetical protein